MTSCDICKEVKFVEVGKSGTGFRLSQKARSSIQKCNLKNYLDYIPARWCSGEGVGIAVGRPGIHSLSRVISKDFKKWYSQLPCLALILEKR